MKLIPTHLSPALAATLCLFTTGALAAGDEHAAAARRIFQQHQEAVVWVSAVAKVSFSAEGGSDSAVNIPDREQKSEALATIIETNGLAVTSLSSIDAARDYAGREVRVRDGSVKIDANSILKEVKITMPDGTEVPAEVIMRDADLDLAFLRPKPGTRELKEVTFKAVDLRAAAKVDYTDDAITISRMDEVLNRVASVTRGQITTITKKPREFLRATGLSQGCPTFASDGRIVGVSVSRTLKGKSAITVIIPAADILEIAEQAKAAKSGKAEAVKGEALKR